jgi:hypothetical protein
MCSYINLTKSKIQVVSYNGIAKKRISAIYEPNNLFGAAGGEDIIAGFERTLRTHIHKIR